jgi:hypothetical protein
MNYGPRFRNGGPEIDLDDGSGDVRTVELRGRHLARFDAPRARIAALRARRVSEADLRDVLRMIDQVAASAERSLERQTGRYAASTIRAGINEIRATRDRLISLANSPPT